MEHEFSTYFLSLEITPLEVGSAYEIPELHCTLVHRFHSTMIAADLAHNLERVFAAAHPILLQPLIHKAFGPQQKLATLIAKSPELDALHMAAIRKLESLGVTFTERDWIGDGYTPHATDQLSGHMDKSSAYLSTAVYLIEVEHPLSGTRRFVRHKFELT